VILFYHIHTCNRETFPKKTNDHSFTSIIMKLLLDENCLNLQDHLEKKGYDVEIVTQVIDKSVTEKSVQDKQIIDYALQKKRIIISYDRGLREEADKAGVPSLNPSAPAYQADMLDKELKKIESWKNFI